MKVNTVNADILIIGGGSGGVMAAIRAKELNPDLEVVVFEKSFMKYSGSIPRGMDALNIVSMPGFNKPKDYVESTKLGLEGVVDELPSYVMADRSWELMKKLERWGVCFPKYNGKYEVLGAHPKGSFTITMKEPDLKTKLYYRLLDLGCTIINRTMALELLVDHGRVAGAVGINVRTGEIIVCHAKAVILASGGTARFGLSGNSYLYGVYDCPSNTGDGYVMAYKAGAKLSGLEFTMCYYMIKDASSPLLYITLTRGAHLINALNERMDKDYPSARSIINEHNRGFGYIRIRMSHLNNEQIEAIEEILFTTEKPACERFFKGRGVDFRKSDIELGPTEFFLCGGHGNTGVMVDENAASSVPGLFVIGDTANVGRGHLSAAFVFGEVSAEAAIDYIKGIDEPQVNSEGSLNSVFNKINSWNKAGGAISIEEFELKARRQISEYLVSPKNEYRLNRGIEIMESMKKELYEKVRVKTIHDLIKAFEVENIITCAILSGHASLERKESRWGYWHYRPDYPNRDDENYLKHIVVNKGETVQDVRVSMQEPGKMTVASKEEF